MSLLRIQRFNRETFRAESLVMREDGTLEWSGEGEPFVWNDESKTEAAEADAAQKKFGGMFITNAPPKRKPAPHIHIPPEMKPAHGWLGDWEKKHERL